MSEGNCTLGSLGLCATQKKKKGKIYMYSDDQIKKIEIGGTCGTNGEEERCMQSFVGET